MTSSHLSPKSPPAGDMFDGFTQAAVQRFFGISSTSIKEWKRQGMPRLSSGKYNLAAAYRWWADGPKGKRARKKNSPAADLDEEEQRLVIAMKTLKLQQLAGELVSRESAYSTLESMFHRVRTRLEAIPEELSSSVPAELRAVQIAEAKNTVRLALREMCAWSTADDSEEDDT